MLKKLALLISLVPPLVSSAAGEDRYLAPAQSTCENHVLFEDRKVGIVDVSGAQTGLTKLSFEPAGRYHFRFSFPQCGQAFYLLRDAVQLAIPLNLIERIDFNGPTCEVRYTFNGARKTAAGKYLDGRLSGPGEFGQFSITVNKVKSIVFADPVPEVQPPHLNGKLVLKDGSIISVSVADMHAVDLFKENYQDSMYRDVYHTDTFVNSSGDLSFKRGESDISVPFASIATATVAPETSALELTLKSGKSTVGTFEPHDENKTGTLDGFSGVCEEGGFFVAVEQIKQYRSAE